MVRLGSAPPTVRRGQLSKVSCPFSSGAASGARLYHRAWARHRRRTRAAVLLPRERQALRSDTCRYNHSRHACSMKLRCTQAAARWMMVTVVVGGCTILVDFGAQVEGLHIEWRRRALAQRCPGRSSCSRPNAMVRRGRTTDRAVGRVTKLLCNDGKQNPDIACIPLTFFARVSSLIAKTNITQDPGRDSRWAPHSGREDTTRRTGTEADGADSGLE